MYTISSIVVYMYNTVNKSLEDLGVTYAAKNKELENLKESGLRSGQKIFIGQRRNFTISLRTTKYIWI